MKVLHVIPAVAKRYGGPSVAVFGMCRALEAVGIETRIATTDADGPGRLDVPHGSPVCYEGVAAVFFPREWSESFKYSGALARWLSTAVGEYDVVHVHSVFNHSSLAAARASRRMGVPFIVRPLGTLDPWSMARKGLRKRLLWSLYARRILMAASAFHYTTEEERRRTETSLGLARGVVVPLGVDVPDPRVHPTPARLDGALGALEDARYVLVLSRLHAQKGLEYLVDAFLSVPDHPEWRLVLAGSGDRGYTEALRARARERGGEGRVLFPGWIEGDVKAAVLQGAALVALPSHKESFALGAVEALAAGVPVLLSPGVNLARDIEAAGAGWVAGASSLRTTLIEALSDPGERTRRGAAGRAFVQSRFTWSSIAEQLRRLYLGVMAA
jgi:glycosyltransferase involved in cell wall biosynthesis